MQIRFKPIKKDLKAKKMVFLAGPRQVGKTTLAKQLLEKHKGVYLNWDNREHRRQVLKAQWPAYKALIVLDEFHKYRQWKSWLMGEYDVHHEKYQFLVTGSARLDLFRRGSDSLQGRYHHYRLHPFTLREINGIAIKAIQPGKPLKIPSEVKLKHLEDLIRFGGFPEPLLKASPRYHRRWQKEYLERFFREDIRDMENVRDFSKLELLADLIPERVASLFSLNSLREELEVSHRAVNHWVDILERFYFLFRVRPFYSKKVRALKKEAKVFLWDWSLVADPAARLENLVASHLLKFCHLLEDVEGYRVALYFLRDLEKREVDFLVTIDQKPWFAVEVKSSNSHPAKSLNYFGERLKIPYLYQVVQNCDRHFRQGGVEVVPLEKFLVALA